MSVHGFKRATVQFITRVCYTCTTIFFLLISYTMTG